MLFDVVFTPSSAMGAPDPGMTAFTLYGCLDNLLQGGRYQGLVFSGIHAVSPDPWQKIERPGYPGMSAKFMGAKSDRVAIKGYTYGQYMVEQLNQMSILKSKNEGFCYWTVKIEGVPLGDPPDYTFIITDITFDLLGEGSGPMWNFQIDMINLER